MSANSWLVRSVVAALTVGTVAMTSCAADDDPSTTLGPLDTTVPGSTTSGTAGTPSGSTATAGPVGSGFVSIQVRLAATGVDEVIALDRATVAVAQLDPISLDARCTALDGSEGLDVSVTDLRRLSTGSSIVSARLHVDPPLDVAGVYEGTLEIGDGQQVVTTYRGPITVDDALNSGSFDVANDSGGVATGTFVCAAAPVAATTVPVQNGGEEVPGASTPPTVSVVPTLPPVIETLPPPTVPEATS